jgi:hypothetical protein
MLKEGNRFHDKRIYEMLMTHFTSSFTSHFLLFIPGIFLHIKWLLCKSCFHIHTSNCYVCVVVIPREDKLIFEVI